MVEIYFPQLSIFFAVVWRWLIKGCSMWPTIFLQDLTWKKVSLLQRKIRCCKGKEKRLPCRPEESRRCPMRNVNWLGSRGLVVVAIRGGAKRGCHAGKGIVCAEAWGQSWGDTEEQKDVLCGWKVYRYEEIMRLMRKEGQMKGLKAMLSN